MPLSIHGTALLLKDSGLFLPIVTSSIHYLPVLDSFLGDCSQARHLPTRTEAPKDCTDNGACTL